MSEQLAALYARVSSPQQAETQTIQSQVAALRAHLAAQHIVVPSEREFLDEGYSGATLVRPALERLRDLAATGGLDALYVHAPDRLARKYAYQVLLLEEFARAGVRVIFLTHPHGQSAEDDLLLQVQEMVAEYERARFLERSRRGKRHAAQCGAVSVLTSAPYGYRYISKHDGAGQARYEIVGEEARIVRQIFSWVGSERLSLSEVSRRLTHAGVPTRKGANHWDPSVIWGMLKNPAYVGRAAFGKTRSGPWQPPLRPGHGRVSPPRKAVTIRSVPPEEWSTVPVPALISEDLFVAVQEQLAENQRRARRAPHGVRYLLQGLLVCAQCGYAYYGKTITSSAQTVPPREHIYYRCSGSDSHRFGGTAICDHGQLRGDRVEEAVWQAVCGVLEHPERIAQEYRRRLACAGSPASGAEAAQLAGQATKLRRGLARLIDSYAEGILEKEEFEPRVLRLRERIARLEEQAKRQADEAEWEREISVVIGQVETFAERVSAGLGEVDWQQRREIIQALVRRVEVEQSQITVVFRIDTIPLAPVSSNGRLQDRLGRVDPRRFQRHRRHPEPRQPIGECQQIGGHRAEGARLPLHRVVRLAEEHTGDHRLLMHIQPATPRMDHLHSLPPRARSLMIRDRSGVRD